MSKVGKVARFKTRALTADIYTEFLIFAKTNNANGNYSMFYNFLTSILKTSSQIYPNGPDLLLWD